MSVTTARGLIRPGWLQWQRRCASTSSRASPPSPPSHSRPKSSKSTTDPAPRITRPNKFAAQKPTPRTTTSSSRPPKPPRDTLETLWRHHWLPLSGAALLAGFLGFYVIGTAAASLRQCPCGSGSGSCCPSSSGHDVTTAAEVPTGLPPALTGANAEKFDRELDLPEWWMGITKLRRRLAARATGHVLELAVGTGRNLEYYNWDGRGATSRTPRGVASFTGLDISDDMLDVARRRLAETVPSPTMADHTGGKLALPDDRLRLIHSDAHHALPLVAAAAAAPPKRYDTIIQTFGLCSVSDPVSVLCNLASALEPETGRILLLEHGKGWSGLVNGLLDRNARSHFDKYGCWWNRDIQSLVDQAVQRTPGLEVVKLERPNLLQMGTLVWVELRVRRGKE